MTLLGQWDPSGLSFSDIWGYVDCSGNEYAIIGSREKIHFIDVTNPATPTEIDNFAGGDNTTWRDIKTWGKYAYSVCDACSEGLMIFDLSDLPNSVTLVTQTTSFFGRSHDIYIDEQHGRLYAVGTNTQGSGVIILDLTQDPANPTQLSSVSLQGGYNHDIHVVNHIGYSFSGNNGLWVYDFTNPNSPVTLGNLQNYVQSGYNHAGWLHNNGTKLVFADETHDKSVKVVDVSNHGNMSVTGLFKSTLLAPTHTNSIAHNPFIRDDYAIVSYYHDGVQIFDISNPSSIAQVSGYDTYTTHNNYNGYKGNWGVYPFLPSGNIIASDITFGLHILQATNITFNNIPLPTPPNVTVSTSGPTSFCVGGSVELSVPTGADFYTWYKDGSTVVGNSNALTVTESGDYHVEVCDGPCTENSVITTVTVDQIPSVTLNVPPGVGICEGSSIVISVPPGAQLYEWYHDGNSIPGNLNQIVVSDEGDYWVTASNGGCSATSGTVSITVDPNPDPNLNLTGTVEICEDESMTLIAQAGADEYEWFKDGLLYASGVTTITVNQAGIYFLEVSIGNCTGISAAVTLEVIDYPDVELNVGAYNEICDDESLTISVPAGADQYAWFWDGVPIGGNSNSINVTNSGDYYVISNNGSCQSTSETTTVLVRNYPDVGLNVPLQNEICEGETILVEVAPGADEYEWYRDNIIQSESSNTYSAELHGEYFVIATNGDCASVSETVEVDVIEYPEVGLNVGDYNELCDGETLFIMVPAGADEYEWFKDGVSINQFTNSIFADATGDYHVVAFNGDCEAISDITTILVTDYPELDLDADPENEICEGDVFVIVANTNASNIQWYRNNILLSETSNILTTDLDGDYYAVGSNGDCATTSETVNVSVLEYPEMSISIPLFHQICEGQTVLIEVPTGAEEYDWYHNNILQTETSNVYSAELTGDFFVIASNGDCQSVSDIVELLVLEYPDVTLSSDTELEICEGEVAYTSIPTGAETYQWFFNDNLLNENDSDLEITEAGNYYVSAANGSCSATSETVNLNVVLYPNVDISLSDDTELCEGDMLEIEVPTGAETYNWFDGNGLIAQNVNSITVFEAGNYRVSATNSDCISDSEEVPVALYQYPNVQLNVGTENQICEDESLLISIPTGAESYQWYLDNEIIEDETNSEIETNNAGNYHVVASNHDCASTSDLTELIVYTYPEVSLSVPFQNIICEGESLTMEIPAGAESYQWYQDNNITLGTEYSQTVTMEGDYYVVASNGDCASTSETISLQITLPPDVSLSVPGDNTICEGESLNIGVPSGAGTYNWYQDGVLLDDQDSEIQAQEAGTYFVEAANGDCESVSDNVVLQVTPLPDVTLSVPIQNSICDGENFAISIPPGSDTYQWYKDGQMISGTGNEITVNEAGNYYVEAQNGECPKVSETVILQVLAYPDVSLSKPLENTICEGEILSVAIPSGAETYQWFKDGSPISETEFNIEITESGIYHIEAANGDCAATSEAINVEVIPLPDVSLSTPSQNTICEGESIVVSIPTGADSYLWYQNGLTLNEMNNEIVISDPGSYYVEAIKENCLSTSESVTIEQILLPNVTLSVPTENTLCEDESLTITVPSGAGQYEWFLDDQILSETGNEIIVSTPGDYHVIASNEDCISTSDLVTVNITNYPDITLDVPLQNEICEDESLSISVPSGAESYSWFLNGQAMGETGNAIMTNQPGNYSVQATNGNCSTTSELLNLIVNAYPDVALSVPTQNTICDGEELLISILDGADNYQWYFEGALYGDDSNEISASQAGSYMVVASNSDCSAESEIMKLTVTPLPDAPIIAPVTELCEGESVQLSTNPFADQYQWFEWDNPIAGANQSSLVVSYASTFSVQVIQDNCANISEEVAITVFPVTIPEISVNQNTLTSTTGQNYQWYLNGQSIAGANDQTFEVTESGNYSVGVTDQNGCFAVSDEVMVTVTSTQNISLDWNFIVYPNPTLDILNIEIQSSGINKVYKVELLNHLGQVIITEFHVSNLPSKVLNLRQLAAGVYWVRVFDENGNALVHKVVRG